MDENWLCDAKLNKEHDGALRIDLRPILTEISASKVGKKGQNVGKYPNLGISETIGPIDTIQRSCCRKKATESNKLTRRSVRLTVQEIRGSKVSHFS